MFTGANGTRAYWTLTPKSQNALGGIVQGNASTLLSSSSVNAIPPSQYVCPLINSDIAIDTEAAWLLWSQEQTKPPIVATISQVIVSPHLGGSLKLLLSAPETLGWYSLISNLLGVAPDSSLPQLYLPIITIATGILTDGLEIADWRKAEFEKLIKSASLRLELSNLHIDDSPPKDSIVKKDTPLSRLLLPKGFLT